MAITKCSGTCSICTVEEFLVNFGKSFWVENEASVDHAIQVRRLLVKLEECFVIEIVFIRLLRRQDHFEACFHLVFAKLLLETLQIERIANKIFIDFNQEFMTFKLTEPFDPSDLSILKSRVI